MARTKALLLVVAVLLAVSGCSAFFNFNAFSGVDKASTPDPNRYKGSAGLDNLQKDLSSPAIVEALKNDPDAVKTILTNLDDEYQVTTTTPTTSDQQKAAILYAELELDTTSGDELVNNIANTVVNNPSGNLRSMLASVVPSDVASDPAKFSDMIVNFLSAEGVYENLGNSIPALGAPAGMNMGDVAQKAAVALLMKTIVETVEATPPGYSQAAAIDQMFALINDQTNNIEDITITDPFAGIKTDSTLAWLKNIFDAAGAPYPA